MGTERSGQLPGGGDPALTPELYAELRALARDRLAGERGSHTLTPTALVHEAYLKLAGRTAAFTDRAHFLAAAAAAMRQILVDHARRRGRAKRGDGVRPLPLHLTDAAEAGEPDLDILGLHDAMTALAAEDPVKARLVELRVFGGLTLAEAADAVGVSRATACRHWAYAKAWLYDRLSAGDESAPA